MSFGQRLMAYARLREMKIVWYFLVLAFGEILTALFWLPAIVAIIFTFLNLGFLAVITWNAISLAKVNFALKLEKNQNAGIVAGFSEAIIAYDQDFQIWSMNQAAEVISGVRREEVIGQRVTPEWATNPRFRILTQILFPSLAPVISRKSGATYPQVIELTFTDPRELYIEITTNQIFDEAGKLLGFIKVIRDRSREVELLKIKTEFISVAAHQLRTPLSGIKWANESLAKGDLGPLPPEAQKTINDVAKTTEKLIKMVDDLLDVAKIEEGKFGYEFEKSDLVSLIQETLEQFEAIANQRQVRLVFFRPEEALPPIFMDRRRIGLVLQNLLDNAIKYNVKNGEARVRAEILKDKPYVQVTVEDTGVGVPERDLGRVFAKFFRSENVIRIETEGSGLGLFIARNIIKRHGGEIWVKSVEKRGSTFTFILPTDEKLIPPVEIVSHEAF